MDTGGGAAADPVGERLPGGFINDVFRVGDTVRRTMPESASFVTELLDLFASRGWKHAPRSMGVDQTGRQILGYVDGTVPLSFDAQAAVRTSANLARLAGLIREFHDLTEGTDLAAGSEVVCHNDLSPKNTVYREAGAGLAPVSFLDWDNAAPGARIHDLAHACWQYVGLGRDATPPQVSARRVRVMADAYGLADTSELVGAIVWWQRRSWEGIESGAAAGEPALRRLRELGIAAEVRAELDWTLAHRDLLEAALLRD